MQDESIFRIKVGKYNSKFSSETNVSNERLRSDRTIFIVANQSNEASRWKQIGERLKGHVVSKVNSSG
jgi:hypothetical protein